MHSCWGLENTRLERQARELGQNAGVGDTYVTMQCSKASRESDFASANLPVEEASNH